MAKRNGFPMGGGGNMASMMQQAQRMQQNIERVQNELAEAEIEATSGGGMVKAVVTGKKELKEITITPEIVDPEDVEMLQDLVVAAVNEALRKCEEDVASSMNKFTGGMNLGGLGGLL
jgi:DNA-binding YbaB/EbfC family protein